MDGWVNGRNRYDIIFNHCHLVIICDSHVHTWSWHTYTHNMHTYTYNTLNNNYNNLIENIYEHDYFSMISYLTP